MKKGIKRRLFGHSSRAIAAIPRSAPGFSLYP